MEAAVFRAVPPCPVRSKVAVLRSGGCERGSTGREKKECASVRVTCRVRMSVCAQHVCDTTVSH